MNTRRESNNVPLNKLPYYFTIFNISTSLKKQNCSIGEFGIMLFYKTPNAKFSSKTAAIYLKFCSDEHKI